MKQFVETRQRWLMDPANGGAKANTVLIRGVPRRYLTEAALTQLFSHMPGGVAKVWLNRSVDLSLTSMMHVLMAWAMQ